MRCPSEVGRLVGVEAGLEAAATYRRSCTCELSEKKNEAAASEKETTLALL